MYGSLSRIADTSKGYRSHEELKRSKRINLKSTNLKSSLIGIFTTMLQLIIGKDGLNK